MIFSFTISVSASQSGQTPSGIPLEKVEEQVDAFVDNHIGISTPGSAIMVVKDGEIILSKGYGFADVENQIPIDPQKTIFEYGSISKLFVWTAAMQLVEQGKLDLNKDIKMYLSEEFTTKLKYKKTITFNNLMNHTAGFEDVHFDLLLRSPEKLPSLEEALLKYQPKQVYEPDSTIAYSNYSTALAAYVIEQISGQPFSEYEMEHIFMPAGMNSTSGHPTLADLPALEGDKAFGYLPDGKGEFTQGDWAYIPLYPAGSVNGTAEDLAKYINALLPNESEESPLFLQNGTLDTMFTQSYTPHEDLLSIAHGYWEFDGQVRGLGHGGNTSVFSTNMVFVPEERFGVIVLTNAAGEIDLTFGIMELLLGKPETKLAASTLELPSSEEVEGYYIAARQSFSTFTELAGFLAPLKIEAIGENEIQISVFGMNGTYRQIQPYLYVMTESDHAFLDSFQKMYFEMGNNGVNRVTNGQITDFLPLKGDRQMPFLLSSLVIVIVSLLFFMISPIVFFISWIRNRKKNLMVSEDVIRERRVFWLSNLGGTLLILNNLILIVRVLLGGSMIIFDELKIHLYLNWVIFVSSIVLIILDFINWKKITLTKKKKFIRIVTFCLIVFLFAILGNWNFFNIVR
jgi:CubicO group peptidase (beta-lactamase class C family)